MKRLYDCLAVVDGVTQLRSADVAVQDLADLFESSKTPLQVVTGLGITATDFVAALTYLALGGDDSLGITLVQSAPIRPAFLDGLRESSIGMIFPRTSRTARLSLAAGLLQIHDFWDESHGAAQEADDLGEHAVSAFWHAIAHRREPDASNAAYWFRRVGRHVLFPELASQARPLIDAAGRPHWAERLLAGGSWDAIAFVNSCVSARSASEEERLCRALQRVELLVLMQHTIEQLVP